MSIERESLTKQKYNIGVKTENGHISDTRKEIQHQTFDRNIKT